MKNYTENLKKLYKNIDCEFEYSLECFVYEKLQNDPKNRLRPAMLVFPGGGYHMCSDREGTPIATAFLAKGFNVYVLTYSTCAHVENDRFPVQLLQAAAAMDYIKNKAAEHNTDASKISVCGFSAGGHLAGMASCMYKHEAVKAAFPDKSEEYFRPFASVLSYPVLSSDPAIAHMPSIDNLAGKNEKVKPSLSVEKWVDDRTPPAFIWHTSDDTVVDVRNSLVYAAALREHKIPFELHVYPHGPHGISLANTITDNGNPAVQNEYVSGWVDDAANCLLKIFA